jgi:hypothetical protein
MKGQQILKIVLAIAIIVVLFRLVQGHKKADEFSAWEPNQLMWDTLPPQMDTGAGPALTPQPSGTQPKKLPGGWEGKGMPPASVSTDLLPRPDADETAQKFAEFAPQNPMSEQNFLQASKLISADTIGASLKNPSYQLRRDPPLKRTDAGPWLQSTYESDPLRKPLDC